MNTGWGGGISGSRRCVHRAVFVLNKENKCFVLMLIEGEKEKGSGWVCPVTSGCVLRMGSQHPRVRWLIWGMITFL